VALSTGHTLVSLLESENGTIGFRYPDYPFITDFVKDYGKPVTATSANLASKPPHYTISSLLKSLSDKKKKMIDLIVDAGRLSHNKPSTVIDLSGQEIQTIRSGDIQFASQDSFVTSSPEQTHKTGQFFANKIIKNKASQKPIIVVLQGNLGAGKTQFVKGMAAHFEIDDVISPTYVVSYEYDIENNPHVERFIHADLYNIETEEEIQHIGLHEASHRSIVCIEWGEKLGSTYSQLADNAHVYHISMGYESETKRLIQIAEQP
jgi:tRNA threonylcarbamoyl adenosine modification protein YjeE